MNTRKSIAIAAPSSPSIALQMPGSAVVKPPEILPPFPVGCGANILHFSSSSLFPTAQANMRTSVLSVQRSLGTSHWSLPFLGCAVITGCKDTADKFLTARTALLSSSSALNSNCPELLIPLRSTLLFRSLSLARLDLSGGSPDVKAGSYIAVKYMPVPWK